MAYRAIGFDYGGVIGGIFSGGVNFGQQICDLLELDSQVFKEVYFEINHKINLGEIETWREFWTLFLEKIGKPDKINALMDLSNAYEKKLRIIDPEMPLLIDQLRSQGYKTGLLSNTTLEGGEDMRRQGLNDHFDVFHISAETKLMKPNPAAFKKFADELEVDMSELIFIDDSEKSLSTAAECGFLPIRLTSREALIQQLREAGVML